ncbi:hypothetical protein [Actinomadura meyerae]|jgi:hypothetical protein|uniref:hypothetical protein n=1 Tax=Actinomadura meyerae TaxID=240840 RepID=UPI0015C5AAC3|nr:hypothetical protein [Actinomadura meyerae]
MEGDRRGAGLLVRVLTVREEKNDLAIVPNEASIVGVSRVRKSRRRPDRASLLSPDE